MSACQEFQDRLLDDDASVRRHLGACAQCAQEAAQLHQTLAMVAPPAWTEWDRAAAASLSTNALAAWRKAEIGRLKGQRAFTFFMVGSAAALLLILPTVARRAAPKGATAAAVPAAIQEADGVESPDLGGDLFASEDLTWDGADEPGAADDLGGE